jgi:hypothetical protein
MKTRFLSLVVLIEIISVAFLIFLLKLEDLPEKAGVSLIWLLPITFGLHVFEEFVFPGGFSDWNRTYRPRFAGAMTPSYLIKVNAIPGAAAILVSLGVFNYAGGYGLFGIRAWHAFLTFLAFNAIYHIRGAFQTGHYSPGMVTGILLYLPLAVISFTYFIKAGIMDIVSAILCLALGLAFQPVLDAIKDRNMRKAGVSN